MPEGGDIKIGDQVLVFGRFAGVVAAISHPGAAVVFGVKLADGELIWAGSANIADVNPNESKKMWGKHEYQFH